MLWVYAHVINFDDTILLMIFMTALVFIQIIYFLIKNPNKKIVFLVFLILLICSLVVFIIYILIFLKRIYQLIPVGNFFVLINYFLSQIMRALLVFGMRNELHFNRICNWGHLGLKVLGIAFNYADVIFA